jgi:hypothetical protein
MFSDASDSSILDPSLSNTCLNPSTSIQGCSTPKPITSILSKPLKSTDGKAKRGVNWNEADCLLLIQAVRYVNNNSIGNS